MTSLATSLLRATANLADPPVRRVLAKSVVLTLALFAILGWAGSYPLDAGLARLGLGGHAGLSVALSALLTALAAWLLFRVVAVAVLQVFADEVVQAVERDSYPGAAANARELGLAEEIRIGLAGAGRAIVVNLLALPFALALLVTGVGAALLFWIVNAWLLGRELTEMVWLRHRPGADSPVPVGRLERFLLGGAIAALFAVPVANILAPLLGAAAATHLVHMRMRAAHAA